MAKEGRKGYAARQNMLSIVIPTRNRLALLKEALASTQHPWPWPVEFVVSQNDNSDTSALQQTFPAFRFHRWERSMGMAEHWNEALKLASMPFALLLCDDDLLIPEGVIKALEELRTKEECWLVAGQRREFRFQPPTDQIVGPKGEEELGSAEALKRFVQFENFVGPPSAVVFRLKHFKGFPPSFTYATDAAAWVQMMGAGGKVLLLNERICHFRLHEGNATQRAIDEHSDLIEVNQLRFWCALELTRSKIAHAPYVALAATIFGYRIARRLLRICLWPSRWTQLIPLFKKLTAPWLWPQMPPSAPKKTS
jgi:glycosyltransferase involved in cell wall biosynthesis